MNQTSSRFESVVGLAQFHRQRAWRAWLAIRVGVACALVIVLAALDTRLVFPEWLRTTVLLGGLAAGLTVFLRYRRESRHTHTPENAARAMEAACPEIGQRLRTAMERSRNDLAHDWYTRRLLEETDTALRAHRWDLLVPGARWQRPAILAAGLALALLIGAALVPDFRRAVFRLLVPPAGLTYSEVAITHAPTEFGDRHPPRFEVVIGRRLAAPSLFVREQGGDWENIALTPREDGRSFDAVLSGRMKNLDLFAVAGDARTEVKHAAYQPIPKLIRSSVVVTYPEYLGLKPEHREGGDVRVVEGAAVKWRFTFNVPPASVSWQTGAAEPQVLRVAPTEPTVEGEWRATPGKANATLSVRDSRGEVIDAWRYEIEGVADALPTVEILDPAKDTEATPVAELPVRLRAKDDFGVAEIGLVLEAAGQKEWVLEKVIGARDRHTVSEVATAMLEKVPLTIRDNVRLFAYALDHKPRGGPRAVSPLRAIEIRDFKKRWMFGGGGGTAGLSPEQRKNLGEALAKLGDLVRAQRQSVSDVFVLREAARQEDMPYAARSRELGATALDQSRKTLRLAQDWEVKNLPADDITLLGTAGQQMNESGRFLNAPSLDRGFVAADRALSSLLELRKKILTVLLKGSPMEGETEPNEGDLPKSLEELAAEADRLAREEVDVREQLDGTQAEGANLEATRRQQEVAVSDAGELYAVLVDHPEKSDGALTLMNEAEAAARSADSLLRSPNPKGASASLGLGSQRFGELADFLRALELQRAPETLNALAGKAGQAAEAIRKPGSETGQSPGDTSAASDGALPVGEVSGDPPSPAAEAVAKAARQAKLTADILDAMSERAGRPRPGDQSDEASGEPADRAADSLGERLARLREKTSPDAVAAQLQELATPRPDTAPTAPGAAEQAAVSLDRLARELKAEADRLAATRAKLLADAAAQAKALAQQLIAQARQGQPNGPPAESGPSDQSASGEPTESGQSQAQAKGQGESAGEGAGLGEGEGEGEAPGTPGGGGRLGDAIDGPGASRGGRAVGRFVDTLRALRDGEANRIARRLDSVPFSPDILPDIDRAALRVQQLIAALPAAASTETAQTRVPDARRREVEDYFRDLSDDFGGEQWEDQP